MSCSNCYYYWDDEKYCPKRQMHMLAGDSCKYWKPSGAMSISRRMTEKRFCEDCKYTKGIGFDFWCGEGHTEYEVFMGETNCPYYEFHDWSKGTPKENKRFTFDDKVYDEVFLKKVIKDTENNNKEYNTTLKGYNDLYNLLNELVEEKEELDSFKNLVYLVLKKEYDLRMNEMNIFAEKEDWQGYRETQLERGTIQRIAKQLGVDL